MISRRQIISRFAGPIFAIFTSNESFLAVDYRSGPLFSISQGTLPWQPILCKNEAKLPTPLHLSFCHSENDERINSSTNSSTSCKNMVKIGSVVFELNRGRKWKLCCDIRSFGIMAFRIRWTDFRNLFTERKRFGCRWSIWTFFWYLKGHCHGHQFWVKFVK